MPEPPKRSSITEARAKLSWKAFEFLLKKINKMAPNVTWKTHRVFAIDGTKINLPHCKSILDHFPALRKAHYPKAAMISAIDIMTGVIRTASIKSERFHERIQLLDLLPSFDKGSILLLDRGFEGFQMWSKMIERGLYFICRIRSRGRMPKLIKEFIASGAKDRVIELEQNGEVLKIRVLRVGHDYKGHPIILVTNLLEKRKYKRKELWQLYRRRWQVETAYYRVKELLTLENFHARTLNGVFQEIWSNLFTLSLISILVYKTNLAKKFTGLIRVNFKNALEVIAINIHYFVYSKEKRYRQWAERMMEYIGQITFYHQPGRKNPRISKQPYTTWSGSKKNKDNDRYAKKIGAY